MAKLLHEQELTFLSSFEETKYSVACVRIFRGYGKGSRDIISRWIRSLIQGQGISVYRAEGMFDYINSSDSAEGLFRIANCPEAKGIVNLGTGKSRTVSDVIRILLHYFPEAKIENVNSNIKFEASEASIDKLKKLLNWVPSRKLEQTIPDIIEYEKNKWSKRSSKEKKYTAQS